MIGPLVVSYTLLFCKFRDASTKNSLPVNTRMKGKTVKGKDKAQEVVT